MAIDLSGVETADVTALRVLAAATVQAIRDGHHLTLRGPSPAVRRMLHLSHLTRVVEVRGATAPRAEVGWSVTRALSDNPHGDRLPTGKTRPTLEG